MRAEDAKTVILDVLKGLNLVDAETEKSFIEGSSDIEFGALGIDSIAVVDLCVGLEEKIGREVSIEELVENPTVNKLADHFAKESV